MADFARSSDPAVQHQLDRLASLTPGTDQLGLERITILLDRLDRPQDAMPPVFHVAGTNGKGSTCAFLRAAIEAAGRPVHVYTSPHLVRFNERIRIAGRLIEDEVLAPLLAEVLDAAGDLPISFFEATTAAAFLAFARTPAAACVVEVGLGGRLDATNVLAAPAVCGITQLGIDHQSFLGDTLGAIAVEKAGIAKHGVPLVTQHYPAAVGDRIGEIAREVGAAWLPRGAAWDAIAYRGQLHYRDNAGRLELPMPRLAGAHQADNAALAVAMLRQQTQLTLPPSAYRAALGWADWPGRLQQLTAGPLVDGLPKGAELWIDGGHNPSGARCVADFFRGHLGSGRPFHLIAGILANKDAGGILKPFSGRQTTVHAVPVPDHAHHDPAALAAIAEAEGLNGLAAGSIDEALGWIARHADRTNPPVVLILGSLYLAGAVLAENGPLPD